MVLLEHPEHLDDLGVKEIPCGVGKVGAVGSDCVCGVSGSFIPHLKQKIGRG